MSKPLYLNGDAQVSLDGPALRVVPHERAPIFCPLRRISRVVSSGRVSLTTDALIACADRGITITFLQSDGSVRAYLFGASSRRGTLFYRLQEFLDRPDWQHHYDDWFRAMESRARRGLCLQLGVDPGAVDSRHLANCLITLKHRYALPSVCDFVQRRLDGLLHALVSELLGEAGLDASIARGVIDRLQLIDEFTRLLAWYLELPLMAFLATGNPRCRVNDIDIIRLFEKHRRFLRKRCRALLHRLYGWLVELEP